MLPINPIMLSSYAIQQSCVFGGSPTAGGSLNTGGWIQINALVILLSFTIAGLLYSLSGVFSVSMREKMRGAAKYEAFQGLISIMIILVLMAFAQATCNIGQVLVESSTSITQIAYQNPIQFSEAYINHLMFTTGLGLFTQIYSETVLMAVSANVASTIENFLSQMTVALVGLSFSPGFMSVLYGFSGAMGSSFLPMIVVSFGVLFMIYLLLPLIASLAMTIVVPLALVMRSIPYAGPKLRESSDTFLALAIGFYFILPMALLMNNYLISWVFCTGPSTFCNPYSQFTTAYQLSAFPVSALFNQPTQSLTSSGPLGIISMPISFFSSAASNQGGIFSALGQVLNIMIQMPSYVIAYGLKTAEYMFEGIFLIGLDLAITLAFAQGLTKGLNSVGRMIGVGPFW